MRKASQKGLSLLEVMIAMAVFSTFVLAYMAMEGGNLLDSMRMRSENDLQHITQSKLNEVLLNLPKLESSLTLKAETKEFEDELYKKDYKYTVEWRRLELSSDFHRILVPEDAQDNDKAVYTRYLKNITENIEKTLWQVQVTVERTSDKAKMTLGAWVTDPKSKIKINF